jgi:hypothetical protein
MPFSDNPTFSFYSSKGKRLGFLVNWLIAGNYEWNFRSNRNVVKGIPIFIFYQIVIKGYLG